ncbi:hypothetical protein HLA87_02570 [Mycoplasma miroungigenitalium]|uniref:Uncharacterized protein n=1 Tax=Mycoplasma miroungigenitalium TaxID=754515 RepID=A0A6M4JBL5_9MOLU|nr:hypothetical protein [Mycoplasma miroungigenitalium]QJR43658.1 hypothetical protein HLA87_02570 [Mycoplasma miroungigenitalium]
MRKIKIVDVSVEKFKALTNYFQDLRNFSVDNAYANGKNGTGKTTKLNALTYLLNNKKDLSNKLATQADDSNLALVLEIDLGNEVNYQTISFNKNAWMSIRNNLAPRKLKVGDYKVLMNELFNGMWEYFSLLTNPDYFMELEGSTQRNLFINFLLKTQARLGGKNSTEVQEIIDSGKDTTELKKEIKAEIKQLMQSLENSYVFDLELKPKISKELKQATHLIIKQYQIDEAVIKSRIAELDEQLVRIAKAENEVVRKFSKGVNDMFANSDLKIKIDLITKTSGEEFMLIKTLDDVEYKNLNTVKKLEIALAFNKLFQRLSDIETFVLIDNFERVDNDNSTKLTELLGQRQVLVAKVTNE